MKKFEFIMKIGEKSIYHSIISFTTEQEESYLQKIKVEPGDELETQLEETLPEGVIPFLPEREDGWLEKNIDALMKEHPDSLIAAQMCSDPYDFGMFQSFPDDGIPISVPKGVQEEVLCSEILSYSWKCKRIE